MSKKVVAVLHGHPPSTTREMEVWADQFERCADTLLPQLPADTTWRVAEA
jgi:hypothetical protein